MSCTLRICLTFIIYGLRVFPGLFMNIEATFQPQSQSQSRFLSRSRCHGNSPSKTDTEDNTRGTPRASSNLPPPPLSLGLLVCHLRSVNLTPHTRLTEAQTACSVVYRPVVKDGLNIFLAPHRTRPISPTANTTYVFMIARQWYVIFSTLFPGISLSFGTFQLLTIGYFSR